MTQGGRQRLCDGIVDAMGHFLLSCVRTVVGFIIVVKIIRLKDDESRTPQAGVLYVGGWSMCGLPMRRTQPLLDRQRQDK